MEPLVTTNIYDYETKQIKEEASEMISFGSVAPSLNSDIIIINCVISNVQSAGDLQLGIVSTNLPNSYFPGNIYYEVFNSLEDVLEPTIPFAGISGTSGESNLVDVEFKSSLTSKYVALMIKAPDNSISCGCFVLKWFFGFEKEEL